MCKNSLTDRRIKKSKKAIKDSFLLLMKEKDVREITITEIVKAADLNRGTFYNNFHYKEDILDEIMDDVMHDFIISYREPYQHKETFNIKDLTSSTIKIFEHVAAHKNFYTLIVKSTVWSTFQMRICHELKRLPLQDLMNSKQSTTINIELFTNYQAHAILGMIIEWIHDEFNYSPEYMAEQLIQILNYNHGQTIVIKQPDYSEIR